MSSPVCSGPDQQRKAYLRPKMRPQKPRFFGGSSVGVGVAASLVAVVASGSGAGNGWVPKVAGVDGVAVLPAIDTAAPPCSSWNGQYSCGSVPRVKYSV